MSRRLFALAAVVCLSAAADEKAVNPQVKKIMDDVSEDNIRATIARLVSFGTRNTMSNPDLPDHGVGAARQWIFDQFKSYSPKLQVRFDKYRVKKQGQRIFKDVDLWNVIAVLPGKTMPETQILVSGHYDSLNVGNRPANQPAGPGSEAGGAGGGGFGQQPQLTPADYEKNAELPAPGACDDGSGTAAVMELARVMSQYEFDKTLVFVAFAGEEQGLIGSNLLAAKSKKENTVIEAVLNNDIIGTDTAGNGRTGNGAVNVYSDDMPDSVSQALARYVAEVGERYLPSMKVNTIYRQDRIGRGGDHSPFQMEGYAAVRISTPNEIYANQHHATDLLENMSVPYTAKVAKINGIAAASLALAPKAPIVMREPGAGRGGRGGRGTDGAAAESSTTQASNDGGRGGQAGGRGPTGGRRPGPMLARGSGYDAVLQWRPNGSDANIKGYAILVRATTSPIWEQEIYVGKTNTYTLKDVSIDDLRFGVKAIGTDGGESVVTSYAFPPRQKTEIQTDPLP
ncbi:MAG TPA: M28 family peptidase [Bryobacteraceae bacterium]